MTGSSSRSRKLGHISDRPRRNRSIKGVARKCHGIRPFLARMEHFAVRRGKQGPPYEFPRHKPSITQRCAHFGSDLGGWYRSEPRHRQGIQRLRGLPLREALRRGCQPQSFTNLHSRNRKICSSNPGIARNSWSANPETSARGWIRPVQLGLWSFAVAIAHGRGLMLVPIYLGLCRAADI
jgi:hypothetical protein